MAKHGHRPRLCPECTGPLTAKGACTNKKCAFSAVERQADTKKWEIPDWVWDTS